MDRVRRVFSATSHLLQLFDESVPEQRVRPVGAGDRKSCLGIRGRDVDRVLGELIEAGVLVRNQYDEIPSRVEYELTDDGEELRELLEPLLAWIDAREASG